MRWMLSPALRGWIGLAAGASLLLNVALLAPSVFMLQVFDRVFASRSLETLALLAAGTALVLALGHAMDTLRLRALAAAAAALDRALTPRLVHTLMHQAARRPGRADTAPMADAGRLRALLSSPAVLALFDAPWLPIYLAAIAMLDLRLGLAAALSVALLFGMAGLQARLGRGVADEALRQTRQTAGDIDALLRDAEPLVAMGLDGAALRRWQRSHAAALDATGAMQQRAARLAAASRLLRQLLQSAMVAFGALLVIGGHASPGIMVATTVLLSRALQPVEQLIGGWRALVEARDAWGRLAGLAVEGGEEDDGPAACTAVAAPAGPLRLEQLVPPHGAARTGGTDPSDHAAPWAHAGRAMEPVTLQVEPGQCLALIGASGAGKSTWLRMMLGLEAPAAGRVWWGDLALDGPHRAALAGAIGYLPQQVPLLNASVATNIAGDEHADVLQVAAAARRVGLDADLRRLPQGHDSLLGDGGEAVSAGQRQRIGLARALVRAPRLVVLDEPDAHLDSPGLTLLQGVISELKAGGAIVVMTTHRRSLIALADLVGVVGPGGRIESIGPRDTVLARLQGAVVQPLRRASA